MANFHSNVLAISASEQDMHKVLWHIAESLDANKEDTDFDISRVEDAEDTLSLYRKLAMEIDANYWLCFTKNPEARPASETASVTLLESSAGYTLAIHYSTAWESNEEDVSSFFQNLPAGVYGVTFMDADEYDWYETINLLNCLHHGGASLRDTENIFEDGMYDQVDMLKRHNSTDWDAVRDSSDLALVSQRIALGWWDDWYDENNDYIEDKNPWTLRRAGNRAPASPYLWQPEPKKISAVPTKEEKKSIHEAMIEIIPHSPLELFTSAATDEDGARELGQLLGGDPLRLEASWNTSLNQPPIAFTVKTLEGVVIGSIGSDPYVGYSFPYEERYFGDVALSLLLPYTKASLLESKIMSKRFYPASDIDHRIYSLYVRLDLEPFDLKHVLDAADELLDMPECDRSTSSIVAEE